MLMGLYEYKMLSEKQQWDELWAKGSYLTYFIEADTRLNLYALHAFFVEVKLNSTGKKIIRKEEFVCGYSLDKYSGSIDINKI